MPGTLEALGALGIRLPAGVGQRFRGIQFIERDLRAAADFPGGCGVGIRRPLLHELLVKKTKECGATLLWNTPVSGISAEGVRAVGRVVPARWILGADGSGSRIRKWNGLEASAVAHSATPQDATIGYGPGPTAWKSTGANMRKPTSRQFRRRRSASS